MPASETESESEIDVDVLAGYGVTNLDEGSVWATKSASEDSSVDLFEGTKVAYDSSSSEGDLDIKRIDGLEPNGLVPSD